MNLSRIAILVAFVCAMVSGSHAEPRPRVVVLPVEGPSGARVGSALEEILKRTYAVVPTRDWNTTAKRLSAETRTAKSLQKVAGKLRIDAILDASVTKRRGTYVVLIKLHDGADGSYVGEMTTTSEVSGLDKAARKFVRDELSPEIAALSELRSKARRIKSKRAPEGSR
ncbi:MAG: hypothetical protein H0T46_22710 [Deltaproteobacteria bacterium]|nr:hypothetical protein [Deltaproteobacteria bacterium]